MHIFMHGGYMTTAQERSHQDLQVSSYQPPENNPDDAKVDLSVTIPAAGLVLAVVLWSLAAPESFGNFASSALDYIVTGWGWLFVLFGSVFVAFILFMAFSRFGHIRLGKDTEEPEFSNVSWIAMMFAAGMGIGLMFYGAAEPLTHFRGGVPGRSDNDVSTSMAVTLFHWGLHPWSLYGIIALAIAYSTYRLGRKQLLSSAFIPLIGEKRAAGGLGKAIDVLAIFATVFGTAASLGVGASQISSGLDAVGLIKNPGTWVLVGIIVVLGVAFLASAASGVGKGIQYVSNANMVMAGLLALFVLILGPTVVILNLIPTTLGTYLHEFFRNAARTANSSADAADWLSGWTIFYWAWWTSWSPFVGMFLARISRGRTVREFVLVVLTVPLIVTVVWFSIFGGTAIEREQSGNSIWGDGDATKQLFTLFETLPAGQITSVLAMILLATFFITSADSAATVMGTMYQNGAEEARTRVVILWGLLTAVIAIVLLTSGGDNSLSNLQTVTIVAASPFTLVLIALMFAIVKAFSDDTMYQDQKISRALALKAARERRLAHARRAHRRCLGKHVSPIPVSPAVTTIAEGEEVVEVVKVADIEHIVEAAQQAARDAQEASEAALASQEAAEGAQEAAEGAQEAAVEASDAAQEAQEAAEEAQETAQEFAQDAELQARGNRSENPDTDNKPQS